MDFDQLYQDAENCISESDWEGAAEKLEQIAEHYDTFNQMNLLLGKSYYRLSRYDDALTYLQKAEQQAPNDHLTACFLGLVYDGLDDYEHAEPYLKKALRLDPNNDVYHYNLGLHYHFSGDYPHALESLDRAIKIDSKDPDYFFRKGRVYYDMENSAEAIRCFEQTLRMDSNYSEARLYLARAHSSQGNVEKAAPLYAAYLNDSNADTDEEDFTEAGNCYYALGKLDQAMEYYTKALKLNPDHAMAYNGVANVHSQNGKDDLALENLRKALKLAPEVPLFHYNLSVVLNNMADYPLAWTHINNAIDLGLTFPNPQDMRGLIESNLTPEEIERLKQKRKKFVSQDTLEGAIEDLKQLVGMTAVKAQIDTLIDTIKINRMREEKGMSQQSYTLHMVFAGPPGTGKTTVARKIGNIFKHLGLLEKGHVVEVDRPELVAEYLGQTAVKTDKVIDSALDGILFIDEAYNLATDDSDSFGLEAVNTLLKRMEDDRKRLVVIAAGYDAEMRQFIKSNPGLESRFANYFYFEDYKPEELLQLFLNNCEEGDYTVTPELQEKLIQYLKQAYQNRDKNFGNGRFVRTLLERISLSQAQRLAKLQNPSHQDLMTLTLEDLKKAVPELANQELSAENTQAIQDKINSYVGMENVKKDIRNMINFIKVEKMRAENGDEKSKLSLHMVFAGPPGTGKTTIARELGKIFKSMGILKKGHVIETDRSGLVAEYVGQTAVKTNKIIDSALDGILFIDEAYNLLSSGGGNDFGLEAVNTLLKRMEDSRNRLIVIAAGYEEEMKDFINSNPGLQSRFTRHFSFKDYQPQELLALFMLNCKEKKFSLGKGVQEALLEFFTRAYETRDRQFGNGRFVRNFFERTMQEQSNRLAQMENPEMSHLYELTLEDIKAAM